MFGGLKGRLKGNSSTGFHSTLVILQEFISVHGCSIVLIIALVSYGYISDYHKFSCLKQHKWISLGWHWGISRAVFLSGTILGDSLFPYLLRLLEAACIAWFMPPSITLWSVIPSQEDNWISSQINWTEALINTTEWRCMVPWEHTKWSCPVYGDQGRIPRENDNWAEPRGWTGAKQCCRCSRALPSPPLQD